MGIPAGQNSSQASRGFTLIELLLTVVLILLLLGAILFNFSALQHGVELEEGAVQVEALLHFAQAQAANTGRRVALDFGNSDTNTPAEQLQSARLSWEPDPLDRPGFLESIPQATVFIRDALELIQVKSVRTLDPSSDKMETDPIPGDESVSNTPSSSSESPWLAGRSISFYPDGSSDSAEILLGSHEMGDSRLISIQLDGITGHIRRSEKTSSPDDPDTAAFESDGSPDGEDAQ